MASNWKRSPQTAKTRQRSDALTGEPLLPHTPKYVVLDDVPHLPAIPTKLHRHDAEGHLGGCTWTPEAAKYFSLTTKAPLRTTPATEYHWRNWWTLPWAEDELRAHFDAAYVDIVLAVHRDGMSWDHALESMAFSHTEMYGVARRMQRHIRAIVNEVQRRPHAA